MNWLHQSNRPRLVLHATRAGHFDIYQAASKGEVSPTKLLALENTAAFLGWFEQNHKKIPFNNACWRVLADGVDPISSCVNVPELGRRDRRSFLAQRLKTHLPEAPWRYAENVLKDPTLVSLIALPDSHRPEHQLFPILLAIQSEGHFLEALVTPGQLLANQYANPNKIELLLSKDSGGTLAALCVHGQFRFSRLLPTNIETEATFNHLRPTLLAHHILDRHQEAELRELSNIYSQQLIKQLSVARLSAIPSQLLPSPIWLQWLNAHRTQLLASVLIGFLSLVLGLGVEFSWLAGQETPGLKTRSDETLLPTQAQHPKTWQQLEAYSQTDTCPNLFNAIEQLSKILNRYPDFSLENLRWECLHAHQPAQITLNIRIPETSPAPTLALQEFLVTLSELGQTGAKPGNEEFKFVVHIRIPANESSPIDFSALHTHWAERGLFIPATLNQFQEWLNHWSKNYPPQSSPPSPKAKISATLETSLTALNPPADQGILALSISTNTEPAALHVLESLTLMAPALLKMTACEWSLSPNRDNPKKSHLNTTCRLFWRRLPDNNSSTTLNDLPKLTSSISSNSPHSNFSLFGRLFKTTQPTSATAPETNTPKLTSHGWIKRSDGMELHWPSP